MRVPIHNKRRMAARTLLLVAMLQFVFVELEAAGVMHGVGSDYYHDTVDHHDTVDREHGLATMGSLQADTAEVKPDSSVAQPLDSCDHCCHCHGHGCHFPAPASDRAALAGPSSARPQSDEHNFYTTDSPALHRPPIA